MNLYPELPPTPISDLLLFDEHYYLCFTTCRHPPFAAPRQIDALGRRKHLLSGDAVESSAGDSPPHDSNAHFRSPSHVKSVDSRETAADGHCHVLGDHIRDQYP